jgi:glutathione S-transferase
MEDCMALKLIIGNKNYSSWSLRPWIAMKVANIAFDETLIPLYQPGSIEEMLKYAPSGKVPILIDGDVTVWESLAILEYLADRFPQAKLWPADLAARAHARAIASEMHAGFAPLRQHCPMNMRRENRPRAGGLPAEVQDNIKRIDALWSNARARFGKDGPFLFGAFGAADAMYAPVVSRFVSYGIAVSPTAKAYIEAVTALPAWAEWKAAGIAEKWTLANSEID